MFVGLNSTVLYLKRLRLQADETLKQIKQEYTTFKFVEKKGA
jgi:hypothetical protein